MPENKQFRELSLNDKVTIEVPVSVALQAVAEYMAIEWSGGAVNAICVLLQEALLHPLYLNEMEAQRQLAVDQHQLLMQRFAGQTPDFPPNMAPPQ